MNKNYSVEEDNLNVEEKEDASRFNFFGNIGIKKKEESKAESKEKSKPELNNGSKNLIQKIGIKNLSILLVAGILLIALVYLGNSGTVKEKEKGSKQQVTNESLKANPIYSEASTKAEDYITIQEKKLQEILSKVEGVNHVEVMLTLAESKELVPLKDTPYTQDSVNENDGEGGSRISDKVTREDNTVMSTTEKGATTPYIVKEIQPSIGGVVIVAKGINSQIEMDIVEAVEALYNLPAHKIKVLS